jgi:hypothetical protein
VEHRAKITPTGTDLLKVRGVKLNGSKPVQSKIRIAAPHEPTSDGDRPVIPPTPPIENKPEPILGVTPVSPVQKPLKIAMIGTAPSSRDLAPYNDPSWTIWACSPGNMNVVPRADAWFEVHSNLLWPECISYGAPYVEWLKQQTFPIYMQDQRLVPNATPLPIQKLVAEFGKYFFTSSFAYMIAMAIQAGASEIALFGIDMASKDEYILQRAGGQYFMQKATERGIKVSVPFESDLAQAPELYGYADSTPFGRKIHVRKKEIQDRVAGMKAERDKLSHNITYLEGALEDIEYVKSIWGGVQT